MPRRLRTNRNGDGQQHAVGNAHDGEESRCALHRLSFAFACRVALLPVAAPDALAQAKYPSRPIRFIVPLPAGGAIDVFVRAVGRELEARTGATVLVENKAGANTIIAANACKSAAPDGYTFCLLTRTTVSVNPEIYRKLSYDPPKDFAPVTNGFFGLQIVILNKDVPVRTLPELVEYSKKIRTSSTSPRWGSAATPT